MEGNRGQKATVMGGGFIHTDTSRHPFMLYRVGVVILMAFYMEVQYVLR